MTGVRKTKATVYNTDVWQNKMFKSYISIIVAFTPIIYAVVYKYSVKLAFTF